MRTYDDSTAILSRLSIATDIKRNKRSQLIPLATAALTVVAIGIGAPSPARKALRSSNTLSVSATAYVRDDPLAAGSMSDSSGSLSSELRTEAHTASSWMRRNVILAPVAFDELPTSLVLASIPSPGVTFTVPAVPPKPKVTPSAPVAAPAQEPPPSYVTTTQSYSPAGGVWAELRQCESGGDYATNTGNGYYGAYQFSLATWESLGYGGLPSNAPPAVQDQAAEQLQARSGWGQWPVCSVELGL